MLRIVQPHSWIPLSTLTRTACPAVPERGVRLAARSNPVVSLPSPGCLLLVGTLLLTGCGPATSQRSDDASQSKPGVRPALPEAEAIGLGLNGSRETAGLAPLTASEVLQSEALRAAQTLAAVAERNAPLATALGAPDAERIKAALPALANLTLLGFRGETTEQLVRQVSAGRGVDRADLTHFGVGVVRITGGTPRPWLAALALGRFLPPIAPELINAGQREFDLKCPGCGREDLIRLAATPRGGDGTLLASCTGCGCVVDAYGSDAQGSYHRLPWFLRGFQPAAITSPMEAWLYVRHHIRVRDTVGRGDAGAWQTAEETFRIGQGDFQDAAILLADWLAATGYDAKVVIGRMGRRAAAWVVLREDGCDYLLDLTESVRRAPPRADLMPNYDPCVQFNRAGIWFRRSQAWTADYQDQQQWYRGSWPLEAVPDEPSTL